MDRRTFLQGTTTSTAAFAVVGFPEMPSSLVVCDHLVVNHKIGDRIDSGLLKTLADAFALIERHDERVVTYAGNAAKLAEVLRDISRQAKACGFNPSVILWGARPKLRINLPRNVLWVIGERGTTVFVEDPGST